MHKQTSFAVLLLLACVTLLSYGCSNTKLYKESSDTMSTAIATISSYSEAINNEYPKQLRDDKKYVIYNTINDKLDLNIEGQICKDEARNTVRKEILDNLSELYKNISTIANGEAGTNISNKIILIGANFSKINGHMKKIPNNENLNFEKYSTPLAQLSALLLKKAVDWQSERCIKEIIESSYKDIDDLLMMLEIDFQDIKTSCRMTVLRDQKEKLYLMLAADQTIIKKLKRNSPADADWKEKLLKYARVPVVDKYAQLQNEEDAYKIANEKIKQTFKQLRDANNTLYNITQNKTPELKMEEILSNINKSLEDIAAIRSNILLIAK